MPNAKSNLKCFPKSMNSICVGSHNLRPAYVRPLSALIGSAFVNRIARSARKVGRNGARDFSVNFDLARIK